MSILIHYQRAITLLVDGTVRRLDTVPTPDMVPDIVETGAGFVEQIHMSVDGFTMYALTECGHVTENYHDSKKCKDITHKVDNMLDCDAESKLVTTGYNSLVVAKGHTVVKVFTNGFFSRVCSRTFGSEIDMVSSIYIKTGDNELYPLSNDAHPKPIDFDHTEHISKIVGCQGITFIILKNGLVYAQGNYHCSRDNKPFGLVVLPPNERVVDISCGNVYVFYIMESGSCYHTHMPIDPFSNGQRDSRGLRPDYVPFMSGCVVEKVYVLTSCIVFQHDESKLSLVHLERSNWKAVINDGFYTGKTKPIRLDFFDDKSVVSVMQYHDYIYFVTESGQVYYCLYKPEQEWLRITDYGFEPCNDGVFKMPIREIAFFRSNPIKVVSKACQVRSAGSLIPCKVQT